MMHFNYMLLAFGLLIFGFQEASSQDFSPTWENIMGDIQCKKKIPCKCKLSARKGPCKAKIPRYYYNTYHKRCRSFIYGGCGGNANNFMTFHECNRACNPFDICQLPKDVGRCKASYHNFYFNTATGNCEPFIYGGCEGNKNNFKTLDKCRAACQRSA